MRLLPNANAEGMREALEAEARCDYMYMYPPRQAYRPFADEQEADASIWASLRRPGPYNLYLHFPFCKQICEYCNLYAVASRNKDLHHQYVEALQGEINMVAPALRGRTPRTVYFGGGTPSMLHPGLLAQALDFVSAQLQFDVSAVPEVAIEVAPDTATTDRLEAIRSAGFNRVNLGIQTAEDAELQMIGRRHDRRVVGEALIAAMGAGFDNVCADLIFGLPGQTIDSWARSVDFVISQRPQTVCAYALTLRPNTGFSRRGYAGVADHDQYQKWDYANEHLVAAGYEQQTHVRWALPGRGGYLQKKYHWAGETLIGLGAGARSYLWGIDTRNGYSLRRRKSALEQYLNDMHTDHRPITDGFKMDEDERMRKALVLGLNILDEAAFRRQFGRDVNEVFSKELPILFELGLCEQRDGVLMLTAKGIRHRDVAIQPFISDRVRNLVSPFAYLE